MTKRNCFSKIVAVLMAVLLAFGTFSITAFAAITPTATGSIIVNGIADVDKDTAQVSAYKLMKVEVDTTTNTPKDPTYYWVDEVADYLKASNNAKLKSYINEDGSVADAFAKGTIKAEDLASFYDILANEIRNGSLKDKVPAAKTGTGNCTLSDLDMGNYLVLIDGGEMVYRPSSQNVVPTYDANAKEWVVNDVTIDVKSSEADITKKIVFDGGNANSTNASIGDTVKFEIDATIPTYPENAANKKFYVSDIMSEGLVYNNDVKVQGFTADNTYVDLTKGTDYTVESNRPTGDTTTTTAFTLDFVYNNIKAYDRVIVTYSATLGAEAVYGKNDTTANTNTAYLDYTNKPYGDNSWNTKTDENKVYTYEMDLVKVDKKNAETKLAGAEFQITRDGSDTALKFVKVNDGEYRLALADDAETATDTIISAEGGKLNVIGLGADKYILTETKAPDGYNLPSKSFDFTLTAAEGDAGVILDGNNDAPFATGVATKNIENSNSFTLPTTGGMGTVLFTVAGVALVALGVVMIVVLKKKNSKAAE